MMTPAKQCVPSRHTSKAMHQNRALFSTLINKIQTHLQRIQQILALHISNRNPHPHQLQILPRIFHQVHHLPAAGGRRGIAGAAVGVDRLYLLGGDCEALLVLREEGNGGGAENREDMSDGGAAVFENFHCVGDVADEEILPNKVRHDRR